VAKSVRGNSGGIDREDMHTLIPDLAWALQERDHKGADSSTKDGHLIVASPLQANEPKTYTNEGNMFQLRNCVFAFDETQVTCRDNRSNPRVGQASHPLASTARPPSIAGAGVRRLMPVECERLQGFPDGYTAIRFRGKPAADGPRYRALGNSMAVPVIRWILSRIDMAESLDWHRMWAKPFERQDLL
jgi:DNA (cytosine-5)-methyltransferase 1